MSAAYFVTEANAFAVSQRTTWENAEDYGALERSGKLQVVTKV